MQLQVKTVLNAIQHFPGYVFQDIRLQRQRDGRPSHVEITLAPHEGIAAKCSRCLQPAPGYDQLEQRRWLFPPLWGLKAFFVYTARRVECAPQLSTHRSISSRQLTRTRNCDPFPGTSVIPLHRLQTLVEHPVRVLAQRRTVVRLVVVLARRRLRRRAIPL